jgi:hypothetical protein
MTTPRIVSNPEVGQVYLVRRKLNGAKRQRSAPARILTREWHDWEPGKYAGYRLSLQWIDTDEREYDYVEFDGSVRELRLNWLNEEAAVLTQELKDLSERLARVEALKERFGG